MSGGLLNLRIAHVRTLYPELHVATNPRHVQPQLSGFQCAAAIQHLPDHAVVVFGCLLVSANANDSTTYGRSGGRLVSRDLLREAPSLPDEVS
jgi:hypothetical protein